VVRLDKSGSAASISSLKGDVAAKIGLN